MSIKKSRKQVETQTSNLVDLLQNKTKRNWNKAKASAVVITLCTVELKGVEKDDEKNANKKTI